MKSRTKWNDIVLESFSKLSVKGEEGVQTDEFMDKIHVTSGKGIYFSAKVKFSFVILFHFIL